MSGKLRGRDAEIEARRFLEHKGFKMLAVNYSCRHGEIDIVCMDADILVCAEVKERKKGSLQELERTIDRDKINRILKTAEKYIEEFAPVFSEIRVDAVFLEKDAGEYLVSHYPGFQ